MKYLPLPIVLGVAGWMYTMQVSAPGLSHLVWLVLTVYVVIRLLHHAQLLPQFLMPAANRMLRAVPADIFEQLRPADEAPPQVVPIRYLPHLRDQGAVGSQTEDATSSDAPASPAGVPDSDTVPGRAAHSNSIHDAGTASDAAATDALAALDALGSGNAGPDFADQVRGIDVGCEIQIRNPAAINAWAAALGDDEIALDEARVAVLDEADISDWTAISVDVADGYLVVKGVA